MIKIYDTMTRSLRDFVPLTENVVNMYVCGPTVYNYPHIGNARPIIVFDTLKKNISNDNVEIIEMNNNINDVAFATAAAQKLIDLIDAGK